MVTVGRALSVPVCTKNRTSFLLIAVKASNLHGDSLINSVPVNLLEPLHCTVLCTRSNNPWLYLLVIMGICSYVRTFNMLIA